MMLLKSAHYVMVAAYIGLPIAAIAWDIVRAARSKRAAPSSSLIMTFSAAVAIGVGLSVIYALAVGGAVRVTQVLLAVYFAFSLLLILKLLDALVTRLGARVVARYARADAKPLKRRSVVAAAAMGRWIVLFAIGLPYVMASVLTYRPKVRALEDPADRLGFIYEPVEFHATDGTHLSGWWIPAQPDARAEDAERAATRTVIVCHGLGANKSNHVILAQALVPAGYNVLIFDFRAHGSSGGQLASFGDLERRDVLGAVRWVRENRAPQAQEIFGVGASMGAAALLAAAAEPSDDGRAIAAVAVYGTYDDLTELTRAVAQRFPPPMSWLVRHVGMPMASLQTGTNLADFSPARCAQQIWPRPILVIHGVQDEIIDFDHGQRLFKAASPPRSRIWVQQGSHNSIVDDQQTADEVRRFFDEARPMPVI